MDELAGLPKEPRRLAMERFRLLQPHLGWDEPLKQLDLLLIHVAKARQVRADGTIERSAISLFSYSD
jgi:hypothetical protein